MRFGLFRRRANEARPEAEAIARIKVWTASIAGLPPEASLAVNEIVCTDPSCPGTETVVLVMQPGRKTRACKVSKALEEVTESDLRDALAGIDAEPARG
jgi:hypothetical protein